MKRCITKKIRNVLEIPIHNKKESMIKRSDVTFWRHVHLQLKNGVSRNLNFIIIYYEISSRIHVVSKQTLQLCYFNLNSKACIVVISLIWTFWKTRTTPRSRYFKNYHFITQNHQVELRRYILETRSRSFFIRSKIIQLQGFVSNCGCT